MTAFDLLSSYTVVHEFHSLKVEPENKHFDTVVLSDRVKKLRFRRNKQSSFTPLQDLDGSRLPSCAR